MRNWMLFLLLWCVSMTAFARTAVVSMHLVGKTQPGDLIGKVTLKDTSYGMLIVPSLKGLTPGMHGFHVHAIPSCFDEGKAAKGHFDPRRTDRHLGPYSLFGHLGDLPVLYVNQEGVASLSMLAPRLTVAAVRHHALIIHAGEDNYSDNPAPLGGGGARVACGIVN